MVKSYPSKCIHQIGTDIFKETEGDPKKEIVDQDIVHWSSKDAEKSISKPRILPELP